MGAAPVGNSNRKGITQDEFIAAFRQLQSTTAVAKHFGIAVNVVIARKKVLEKKGIFLPVFDTRPKYNRAEVDNSRAVYKLDMRDGIVLIGSDLHIWPGPLTTMQRAFLVFTKKLKPAAVILNGDVFDGARVSRHPSIGWEQKPSVRQELEAVQDFLGELTKVCGSAKRIWPAGNHDLRFESRVAANLPEFEGIKGVHLKDHLPGWEPCWRVDINDDVVVRHREQGGEHADWNNVVRGGKTIVTGHDHRTGVVPYRNYAGLHWGVRCGFMGASALDPQFVHYLEAKAPNWHPAFVVLTFRNGRLLWPELVTQHDGEHVEFRGEIIGV